MYFMLSESDEMLLGARSFIDAKDDVTRNHFNSQTQIVCPSTSEPFLEFKCKSKL